MVITNKKPKIARALKIGALLTIIGFCLLLYEDLDPVLRYVVTEIGKLVFIGMLALGVALYLIAGLLYLFCEGVSFVIKRSMGNKSRRLLFKRRVKPSQVYSPRELPATQALSKSTDN